MVADAIPGVSALGKTIASDEISRVIPIHPPTWQPLKVQEWILPPYSGLSRFQNGLHVRALFGGFSIFAVDTSGKDLIADGENCYAPQ